MYNKSLKGIYSGLLSKCKTKWSFIGVKLNITSKTGWKTCPENQTLKWKDVCLFHSIYAFVLIFLSMIGEMSITCKINDN